MSTRGASMPFDQNSKFDIIKLIDNPIFNIANQNEFDAYKNKISECCDNLIRNETHQHWQALFGCLLDKKTIEFCFIDPIMSVKKLKLLSMQLQSLYADFSFGSEQITSPSCSTPGTEFSSSPEQENLEIQVEQEMALQIIHLKNDSTALIKSRFFKGKEIDPTQSTGYAINQWLES